MHKILIILIGMTFSAFALEGYKVTTIKTPENVRFHIAGLAPAKDGAIYCSTRFGDVWIYKNEKWKKFAEGLHEPTGIMIDDDGSILVPHKPELTRLIDTDKDGVTDVYRHVVHLGKFHNNYCEFNYGPLKDKNGNLFGTMNLAHNDRKAYGLSTMVSQGGYPSTKHPKTLSI